MGEVIRVEFSHSNMKKDSVGNDNSLSALFKDIISAGEKEWTKNLERGRRGFYYYQSCDKVNKPQLQVLLKHLEHFAQGISVKSGLMDVAASHSDDYNMLIKWSVSREVKEMKELINLILNNE